MVHMLTVRATMTESFKTFFTLKWPFAGMQTLMFGQVMLVLERLTADITFMRSLTYQQKKKNK